MKARIDLHTHTFHSDGTESPEALVDLAAEAGVALLAPTDHDTTSGLDAAQGAGAARGVEVVAGCEISTRIDSGSVHVLAYDFDVEAPGFQALLARIRGDRHRRNLEMIDRLAAFDVALDYDEVAALAEGDVVARPHFVEAILRRGLATSASEVYARWIGDDAPAYVVAALPAPEVAVAAVRAAGGLSALAHPRQLRIDDDGVMGALLGSLVDAGLDGLEVHHPSHKPADRRRFTALADRFGLVPTGGSDFHGRNKPHVKVGVGDGSIDVRRDTWERLLARREERP